MNKKTKRNKKKWIFLAAGGTGGHIFPAIALAKELEKRGYDVLLITDKRYKSYKDKKIRHKTLPVKQLKGNVFEKILSVISLARSYIKASALLKRHKPLCAIGFGGYPSLPTILAAQRNGFKTIIHEQNSLLGRANHMLAKKADIIATSYTEVKKIEKEWANKTSYTGNPIRNSIVLLKDNKYPKITEKGKFNILVIGGSQGANIFSDIVPAAISKLDKQLRSRVFIMQQCRKDRLQEIQELYDELGIRHDIKEFFTDIEDKLKKSHLIVSRAGASTLSEIAAIGRPAIMVPLPNSADNHQLVNAKVFEDDGAGWVIEQKDFTPENLTNRLREILKMNEELKIMSSIMRKHAVYDAHERLADKIETLINGHNLR
jgi:UDP-N-acetylglucosamine--N-acetylmuramyl-(pentapeptide) pyrophosphoryl-undecaprenol N-acetylglucosamine transferase